MDSRTSEYKNIKFLMNKRLIILNVIAIISTLSLHSCYDTNIEHIKGYANKVESYKSGRNGFDKKECIKGFILYSDDYYKLLFEKDSVFYITHYAYSVKKCSRLKDVYCVCIWNTDNTERLFTNTETWLYNYSLDFFQVNGVYYKMSDVRKLTKIESDLWIKVYPNTKILPC